MHCPLTDDKRPVNFQYVLPFFNKKNFLQNNRKLAETIPDQFIFEGNECEKQYLLAKAEKMIFNTEG